LNGLERTSVELLSKPPKDPFRDTIETVPDIYEPIASVLFGDMGAQVHSCRVWPRQRKSALNFYALIIVAVVSMSRSAKASDTSTPSDVVSYQFHGPAGQQRFSFLLSTPMKNKPNCNTTGQYALSPRSPGALFSDQCYCQRPQRYHASRIRPDKNYSK